MPTMTITITASGNGVTWSRSADAHIAVYRELADV